MGDLSNIKKKPGAELYFQIVLHILLFLFYAYDKRHASIDPTDFIFFLNYVAGALVINYVLLPKYLYKKRYALFIGLTLLVLVGVFIMEEGVLEKIFYPNSRGRGSITLTSFRHLVSTLPTILFLCSFKFAWDAHRKQNEVEELRNTVRESELQFLKSQINPHFLFNNLNNLYAYAIRQAPETPEIILQLSETLRYMLYECRSPRISLLKEAEQLKNFIDLGKLQIQNRGTVSFSTHDLPADLQIAPLILMVFVENAFKHSASSQREDISIKIELSCHESGNFLFFCSNTYHQDSNTSGLSAGIGLENVKARLALIYPDAHTLRITDENNLYQVRLQLLLKGGEI